MTDVANPKRTSPDQLLPYHKKISAEGKAQMICFISYTYMVLKRKKKQPAEADFFPVEKIENGICYLKDKRYIKIMEIEPINFLLRSAREQRNIIYSYMSYLKISPVKMQIKVISKKADI